MEDRVNSGTEDNGMAIIIIYQQAAFPLHNYSTVSSSRQAALVLLYT